MDIQSLKASSNPPVVEYFNGEKWEGWVRQDINYRRSGRGDILYTPGHPYYNPHAKGKLANRVDAIYKHDDGEQIR